MSDSHDIFENFWTSRFLHIPLDKLVFDSDYVKIIDVSGDKFEELKSLAFKIMMNSVSEDVIQQLRLSDNNYQKDFYQYLNSTKRFDVKKEVDDFVLLEGLFLDLIRPYKLDQSFMGVELPMNVRVAQSSPPPGYDSQPYATDKLHCDIWAGEPQDTIHTLLYLDVDDDATRVEFKELSKAGAIQSSQIHGNYAAHANSFESLPDLNIPHKSGYLIFFDNRVPHRTVRGNRARLSIDTRFRVQSPYEIYHTAQTSANIAGDKYWFIPAERDIRDFNARLEKEITLLENKNQLSDKVAREKARGLKFFGRKN